VSGNGTHAAANDVIEDVSPSCSDAIQAAIDQVQICGNILGIALQALRKPNFELCTRRVCGDAIQP
jgi:hypothetical protein